MPASAGMTLGMFIYEFSHSLESGNPGGDYSRQNPWIPTGRMPKCREGQDGRERPAHAHVRSLGRNDEVFVKHLRNPQ